jgi:16S rRNA (cytosine967-C5)-methyltransferase
LCAAPGGKTAYMAQLMKNTGRLVSCDIHSHKTELIENNLKRLGITNTVVLQNDATIVRKDFTNAFDRVLADVPCSGLGIIRRKPEIKFKEASELSGLPDIQSKILNNASKYVKENGTLIYSTCTIHDEENINVVEQFLKENKNFELVPIENINIDLDNQEKGYIKIYPNIHGMDGFFIAKLKRIR